MVGSYRRRPIRAGGMLISSGPGYRQSRYNYPRFRARRNWMGLRNAIGLGKGPFIRNKYNAFKRGQARRQRVVSNFYRPGNRMGWSGYLRRKYK